MSKDVHMAVIEVMKSVAGVTKDGTMKAGKFSYKYTSAEAMIAAVRPAMIANGLTLLPKETHITSTTYSTSKGTSMFMGKGTVVYVLTHGPSNTSVDVEVAAAGSDAGDKFAGKFMTTGYKYALRQAFGLPQNEDDPDTTPSVERKLADVREDLQWHQLSAQAPTGMTEDERTAWVMKANQRWIAGTNYAESVTAANRAYQEYKDAQ